MQVELCDYDIADLVIEKCERRFRVKDLMEKSKRKTIVCPRWIAWKAMRDLTELSYPEIAGIFGMDHTAVIHGVRGVESCAILTSRANRIKEVVSRETGVSE